MKLLPDTKPNHSVFVVRRPAVSPGLRERSGQTPVAVLHLINSRLMSAQTGCAVDNTAHDECFVFQSLVARSAINGVADFATQSK